MSDLNKTAAEIIAEQQEQIARLESDMHRLATEMMYDGNSISWWHSKANNYKRDLGEVWDALVAIGIKPDGKTHAADAIRQFAMRKPTAPSPSPTSSPHTDKPAPSIK